MRLLFLLFVIVVLWSPAVADAQEAAPAPSSVHARARTGSPTTLAIGNARLFVPDGAVAADAVVAFGSGGVPNSDGNVRRSSVVISAAGGLKAPVAVLIEPTPVDRASIGTATPALREAAAGSVYPCATSGRWYVCPVSGAGAYSLDTTGEPPSSDPIVRTAISRLEGDRDGGIPAIAIRLAVVIFAGIAGGTLAWLFGRPRDGTSDRAS